MSFVNICRDNTDPFYRYKMPTLQSKVEGRGNGIKTAVLNLPDVSRALGRPPTYALKYFGIELGAQTNEGRFLVNGSHDASELQDCLDGFINKFVLCGNCKNPETEIQIKHKDNVQRKCKACGHVTVVDPVHKLTSYILKNPPDGKGKGKTANTANGKSDVASGKSAKTQGGDDDDVLTQKINAEAAALGDQKIEVADHEWALDMSKEAVEARAKELEGLSLTTDKEKFNEFGEWLLQEKESESGLPSDVDIYKKISELGILGEEETVQVLAQVLFNDDILLQIPNHLGLLSKLINHEPEFEKAFLGGLERYIGLENQDLIPSVPKILVILYDKELVSEEVLVEWGSKVSKKYAPKEVSKKVRKAAKPFIKWLEEADLESDEE